MHASLSFKGFVSVQLFPRIDLRPVPTRFGVRIVQFSSVSITDKMLMSNYWTISQLLEWLDLMKFSFELLETHALQWLGVILARFRNKHKDELVWVLIYMIPRGRFSARAAGCS